MSDMPVIVTQSGAQPTPPKILLAKLITNVSAIVPGFTANLPAGLITDLASTATGALALIDSALVDTINSVTPYGANIPLLMQVGNIYGVTQGIGYNTSVNVVFMGSPGFVISKGFIVSDGNHQYAVQNNAIIPTGGQSESVYCLATTSGTWAVPAGSVTKTITSVPASISLTCTNINAGLPGASEQPVSAYRAQVMQAGMATAQGVPAFLKTLLEKVSGVQKNLISYRNVGAGKWVVVVGGGDPYEVGLAIYNAVPDVSMLTGDVFDDEGNQPDSVTITISDFPDYYDIPFVIPTSQMVNLVLTWNLRFDDPFDPDSIAIAATQPLVDYINSLAVGEPMSIYQIGSVFLASISKLVEPSQVSLIETNIWIDGVIAEPAPESGLIYGNKYKYFTTDQSHVMVKQYGS